MTLLQIDDSSCKKDGFCVADCPAAIIRQQSKDSIPEMVPDGEEICLVCGHCVAVCPHGALTHSLIPADRSPAIQKEKIIDRDQAVQFLRSRRSIRHYKDKAPSQEKLRELIETARYAPTGSNSQLVSWTVFTRKEELKQIATMTVDWMRPLAENLPMQGLAAYIPRIIDAWDMGFDAITRDAPVLVVASSPATGRNSMVDLSIALSYLELAALPMGLGTCWAGLIQAALLQSKPLLNFMALPEGHTSHYPMMVGFPKFRYHRTPERKQPEIIWR